jgi:hypothetical protein
MNGILSVAWLVYAVGVYLFCKYKNEPISPWAYIGVVNSTVWAAA